MFKALPTTSSNITEQVVEYIRHMILHHEIKPGEKLPAEREMAQILKVSRTTIREAYKILATNRMLSIRHGQGVFISDEFENQTLDLLGTQLTNGRTSELYEIRNVIEPQACYWAAERSDSHILLELEQNIKETEGLIKLKLDPESYGKLDRQFHLILAQATHNQVLIRVMSTIVEILTETTKSTYTTPGRIPVSFAEHKAIAAAILQKNPQGAQRAMQNHLNNSQRIITCEK